MFSILGSNAEIEESALSTPTALVTLAIASMLVAPVRSASVTPNSRKRVAPNSVSYSSVKHALLIR